MENKKRTAFETKVMTVLSIVTVLVFVLYIVGFVFLNDFVRCMDMEQGGIEVVRIVKRSAPNTYTVFVKLMYKGEEVQANFNIKDGEITVIE